VVAVKCGAALGVWAQPDSAAAKSSYDTAI